MKQYKVDFYQTVYLGSQVLEADDEQEAKSEAEQMNWKAGIGLKWAEDWETSIDNQHDYIFICSSHSKQECEDDECWEEYDRIEQERSNEKV